MTLVESKETEVNRLFSAYTGAKEVFEKLPAETEYHVLNTFITDFEETKTPEGEQGSIALKPL